MSAQGRRVCPDWCTIRMDVSARTRGEFSLRTDRVYIHKVVIVSLSDQRRIASDHRCNTSCGDNPAKHAVRAQYSKSTLTHERTKRKFCATAMSADVFHAVVSTANMSMRAENSNTGCLGRAKVRIGRDVTDGKTWFPWYVLLG